MDDFFLENPDYEILDVKKLFPIIKRSVPDISFKVLKNYLDKRNDVYGYKLQPKQFLRIASMSYTWQIDLMHHHNKIYFVGIEINSRYAYLKNVPTKRSDNMIVCLNELKQLTNVPIYKIISDNEFFNHDVRNFCAEHSIKLHTHLANEIHRYPGDKLAYIDRLIKTLKWYSIKFNVPLQSRNNFPKIVKVYNKSPHSSLKDYYIGENDTLAPADVFRDMGLLTEIHTDNLNFNNIYRQNKFSKFRIGQIVRCLLPRADSHLPQKQKSMLSKDKFIILDIKSTGYSIQNLRTNGVLNKLYKHYELREVKLYPQPPPQSPESPPESPPRQSPVSRGNSPMPSSVSSSPRQSPVSRGNSPMPSSVSSPPRSSRQSPGNSPMPSSVSSPPRQSPVSRVNSQISKSVSSPPLSPRQSLVSRGNSQISKSVSSNQSMSHASDISNRVLSVELPSERNTSDEPPPNIPLRRTIRHVDYTEEGTDAMLEISKNKYKKVNIYKLNNKMQLESNGYTIKGFILEGEDDDNGTERVNLPYISIEILVNKQIRVVKLYKHKFRRIVENGWNLTGIFRHDSRTN
jgi:hypothetical protein